MKRWISCWIFHCAYLWPAWSSFFSLRFKSRRLIHLSVRSERVLGVKGPKGVLPDHQCCSLPVGTGRPWLIRTYGFPIQVKMSEPCCIWCHFGWLKMPHRAVTKGEEAEENTVVTQPRVPFLTSLATGLRDQLGFVAVAGVIMLSFSCVLIQLSPGRKQKHAVKNAGRAGGRKRRWMFPL